jgi:hypothetical protein
VKSEPEVVAELDKLNELADGGELDSAAEGAVEALRWVADLSDEPPSEQWQ